MQWINCCVVSVTSRRSANFFLWSVTSISVNTWIENNTHLLVLSLSLGVNRALRPCTYWYLNRTPMYSTRAFCKKRPEFGHCVSQRRNFITLWCNVTSWRHVHGDGCLQTPVVYDYPFNFNGIKLHALWLSIVITCILIMLMLNHKMQREAIGKLGPCQFAT